MAERQEELWMSSKDRDRLKVLHEVRRRHITQVQAGKELGISPRWVRELLRRTRAHGDGAVVHGLRGKRSIKPVCFRRLPREYITARRQRSNHTDRAGAEGTGHRVDRGPLPARPRDGW